MHVDIRKRTHQMKNDIEIIISIVLGLKYSEKANSESINYE